MKIIHPELFIMINPLKIIEKYYPQGSEVYYILVTHSNNVKNKALEIAYQHPDLNVDIQFIAEAAMLHDIGIFMCDAPRIHCFGTHHYIEHGYLGADLLRAEGLPRHALVCERHTGTGLSMEKTLKDGLPLPHRDMLPVSMEEQLICYADKFFSKTKLDEVLPLERIRTTLSRFGASEVVKFDAWHSLFETSKVTI